MRTKALVIAHRTCPRHAIDNSLEGIELAHVLGADGVEVDVQRTLDAVLLLHHDHTVWRKLRLPLPLWALPSGLVRRLAAPGQLPTFGEALAALHPSMLMAVDIKHPRAAAAVVGEVRARGMASQALLWSKSARTCSRLARLAPECEVGFLSDARGPRAVQRMLAKAANSSAAALSVHWDTVTDGFVKDAHRRGLRVYAMARSPGSQREKLATGLDGLVTDWPEEAIEARLEINPLDPIRSSV